MRFTVEGTSGETLPAMASVCLGVGVIRPLWKQPPSVEV